MNNKIMKDNISEKEAQNRIEWLKGTRAFDTQKMTSREAEVIRFRLGTEDGIPKSREETAKQFGVTSYRIRLVENKAFRKERHLSREQLVSFLGDEDGFEQYIRGFIGEEKKRDQGIYELKTDDCNDDR